MIVKSSVAGIKEISKPVRTAVNLDDLVGKVEVATPINPKNVDELLSRKVYSFDKSLETLRRRGYFRHLRLPETMAILFDNLEHPGHESRFWMIAENMKYGHEWISLAIKREGTRLKFAIDPENVKGIPSKDILKDEYVIQGKQLRHFDKIISVNVGSIADNKQVEVDLMHLSDELIEFLLGRKTSDLPKDILEGRVKILLNVPEKESWRPVHIEYIDDDRYNINKIKIGAYQYYAHSRGLDSRSEGGKKIISWFNKISTFLGGKCLFDCSA